jgi:hypothetical protein
VVDDDRAQREPGPYALEDVVDGGVVGERHVDACGATHGGGRVVEGERTIGSESASPGWRAVPHLNVLAATAQGANEVRSEKPDSEEGDHVRSLEG